MKHLKVSNLGPIKEAEISFGDLTILVGPQASGKSILLQLIKLLVDKKDIRKKTEQYGFTWGKSENDILDRYFGEGMSSIWSNNTSVIFDKKAYPLKFILPKRGESFYHREGEKIFYIPAQRILSLQNGWPRFFSDYEDSVPFVLRDFSETLRLYTEEHVGADNLSPFSQKRGLQEKLRSSFDQTIFHQAKIVVDNIGKKRFKLNTGDSSIPFMAWSAGQKEFMPLLMSFYYLCPTIRHRKRFHIDSVIIEEPEMGLHPQAIQSVLLQVLDLMSRGYQVIISTHSPMLLEFAWAIENLQKNKAEYDSLSKLFGLKSMTPGIRNMLSNTLASKFKTYFFNRNEDGVVVRDISSLDAGSEDEAVAEWGGLTSFSSKAGDIVSNSVSHD